MREAVGLLLIAGVFAFCSCSAGALSCTPVATDPCLCIGKYFILDINHLFDYPIKDISDGVNPDKYNYTYSPCRPTLCNTRRGSTAAAVCQYAFYINESYNCGQVNQTEWTISEEGPLSFQIEYKGGEVAAGGLPRSSIVSFGNDGTFSENTITMVKEELTASNISYFFQVNIADSALFERSVKYTGSRISGKDHL